MAQKKKKTQRELITRVAQKYSRVEKFSQREEYLGPVMPWIWSTNTQWGVAKPIWRRPWTACVVLQKPRWRRPWTACVGRIHTTEKKNVDKSGNFKARSSATLLTVWGPTRVEWPPVRIRSSRQDGGAHGPHGRKPNTEGEEHREMQSSLESRKSTPRWLAIVGAWDQLRHVMSAFSTVFSVYKHIKIHKTETVRPSSTWLSTRMPFAPWPSGVSLSRAICHYLQYITVLFA